MTPPLTGNMRFIVEIISVEIIIRRNHAIFNPFKVIDHLFWGKIVKLVQYCLENSNDLIPTPP